MSQFDLSNLGYDAEAARASRARRLANNTAGQFIINKAEVVNAKSTGNPMFVTNWDLFQTVGDGSKIEKVNIRHNIMIPIASYDKEAKGRYTAQLQEFVQKLGLVNGQRPAKGTKDQAAWDAYNAATKTAVEALLTDPASAVGKSALGKVWYKTDANGDFVKDASGYRVRNFSIYGTEFPANVTATPAEKFWE